MDMEITHRHPEAVSADQRREQLAALQSACLRALRRLDRAPEDGSGSSV